MLHGNREHEVKLCLRHTEEAVPYIGKLMVFASSRNLASRSHSHKVFNITLILKYTVKNNYVNLGKIIVFTK